MAVLLKLIGLDIIAWCKGAAGTNRVIIGKDLFPERAKCRIVPDLQDPPVSQVAEYLRLNLL